MSLSSLNRHAVAMRDDVGTPKALCLQKYFSAIFPECRIEARVQLYDASSEEEILSGQPDFVLDCIDNIDTKVTFCTKIQKFCSEVYILHFIQVASSYLIYGIIILIFYSHSVQQLYLYSAYGIFKFIIFHFSS